MRKAPRRAAQDMFTVIVYDHRVDDPAARLMVIIGKRECAQVSAAAS